MSELTTEQSSREQELRASLDAVYQQLKDGDTMGAALAMEGVLKGIDYLWHEPRQLIAGARERANMVATEGSDA